MKQQLTTIIPILQRRKGRLQEVSKSPKERIHGAAGVLPGLCDH